MELLTWKAGWRSFGGAMPIVSRTNARKHEKKETLPALIHVTHWKAGSQWVRHILTECFPEQVVTPMFGEQHFFGSPVQEGRIYPTVYASKERFAKARLPARWHRFVVIRDLRDVTVSAYFSVKYSHPTSDPAVAQRFMPWREHLNAISQEEGLLWVLKFWLPTSAEIQHSWLKDGIFCYRYEDLLEDDVALFSRIIIEEAGWSIPPERLETAVAANRFERVSGRTRGTEDPFSHQRKAQPGDWKNYFTKLIKRQFQDQYGDLLVMAGYEPDGNW